MVSLGVLTLGTGTASAADPCVSGNAVACENTKAGSPASEWDTSGTGDSTVEGFTTDISVNAGATVQFKVHADAAYTLDVYRMGYYGGLGARRITTLGTDQAVSQANQPSACVDNSVSTGVVDCGTWGVSASWAVPATAVSGIYFAHLVRKDNGGDSHVVFVVRNDASRSDLLFQTSDTTWQAYNEWGGNSLYHGQPAGRAHAVSYDRPFSTRTTPGGRDFVWANEYPMVRYLEANGYDVSYQSGVDTDRYGSLLTNHKAFLSVGHDEYWSGQQRTNVEAARDAGVSLAFFSGNEVFWKTRWEDSVDGSGTPYRTLVSYKESTEGVQQDPTGTWTGTWRDPRFSPPADGGRPENGLTGTIFTVNSGTFGIKVPAEDGRMRFWRGTPVGSQAAGATFTLPTGTLGYEWDEDLDNGARPAGLVRLSTSTYDVPQKLQGYGTVTAPGTATHSLTLYRAPSGALVFGAGTVQWSWGLDAVHDGATTPTDPSMRQATVNLFADMGVQPTTLQAGLTAAARSTDTTPPSVSITSPSAGASLANGSPVTVSGTATDVGGQVAGVEVSLDGGTTWHPATGRASWSYTGTVTGSGQTTLQVRATDDSANRATAPVARQVTAACPCSLFSGETPTVASDPDTSDIELGVRFSSQVDGYVTGVRFYKGPGNLGTHTGTLWSTTGARLASGTFTGETASGWQTLQFATAVPVTAGTAYVASYHAPRGGYAATAGYFLSADEVQAPLVAARTSAAAPNGVYSTGLSAFPASTYSGGNYWVSPVFDTVRPADVTPPALVSRSPIDAASSVPVTAAVALTFSEPVAAGTPTVALSSPGGLVAGTTTLDAARQVATFRPLVALQPGSTYTLTVRDAQDDAGNTMAPVTSSFRTAAPTTPGVCPCSIWSDSTVPTTVEQDDPGSLEVGVRFRADTDGFVSGVRFYKGPRNTGTHTGTLWSSTGTQLATATFTAESSTGWQEVRFATRVPAVAGQTYVASYHTDAGYYSATGGGLAAAVVDPPLTALANGTDGADGLYAYGPRQFPANGGNGANYWVDVVYELPADVTPPAVAATRPAAGATNVRSDTVPTVTFTEPVASGATATLAVLDGAAPVPVPVVAALDGTRRQLTLTAATALLPGTTYTATVSGAQDAAGNVMAPYTWSFTTSGAYACPCTLYPSDQVPAVAAAADASALELGVRFTPAANGFVTGVRFFKGAGNTGTHLGSLWSATGGLLSTVTFSAEPASGWQEASFPSPVAVTAGTAYVASYTAPTGHYAYDSGQLATAWSNGVLTAPADAPGAGNGTYGPVGRFPTASYGSTGYGVDAVFTPVDAGDHVPPGLLSTSPVAGATSVPRNAVVVVTYDEALLPSSVRATLTDASGAGVPVTVTVGADRTVALTPVSPLAYATTYTADVSGSDLAGNATRSPAHWSFRTATAPSASCPCSLWPDDAAPATASDEDSRAIEVGVKLFPDTDGWITGLRFYKGAGNTGVHVGTLWSATGTALATATFTGESAAGWQEVALSTAVPVTAGTTYVASYRAPSGGFSSTVGGLATAGTTRGPLTAPLGTDAAPNGVYTYGGGFPVSGSSTNYWVDAVFSTTPPADTTPPVLTSRSPAAGSTAPAPATVSAGFSEPVVPASASLVLTAPGPLPDLAQGRPATQSTTAFSGDPARAVDGRTDGVFANGSVSHTDNTQAQPWWEVDLGAVTPLGSVVVWNRTDCCATRLSGAVVLVSATSMTGRTLADLQADPAVRSYALSPLPSPSLAVSTPGASGRYVRVQLPITDYLSLAEVQVYGTPAVAGTTAYDAASRTVTLTPAAPLLPGTTYTATVAATDLAGNALAAGTAWSFTTTALPVVTALAATGSGTSATVTWTTDRPTTSVVAYGTSPTALTSTASAPGLATAHAVTLAGLLPLTRYSYRVTSADAAGLSVTSPAAAAAPAQYAPPGGTLTQTTTADLTGGTLSGTYVSSRSGGDVTLLPSAVQEFTGTTVPTTWSSTSLATGSAVTVGGGLATVSGRLFRSTGTFGTGREIDAVATLRPVSGQWLGATDGGFSGSFTNYAAFRTTSTGALIAATSNGVFGTTTTALPAGLVGTAHRYEVDWTASSTVYKVDGTTVATHSRGISGSMYIAAQDATVDTSPVVLDSVWLSPYTATGTFTSSVLDAGAVVDWRAFTPVAALPSGTTITYQVRTGPSPTAGSTGWSAFTAVLPGGDVPGVQRYLQYTAVLTTSSTRNAAPTLSSVQVAYAVP